MQVLLGIQSNAIKFTRKGHVIINVEIEENDKDDKYLKIAVEDSGIGIKQEDQNKLFKLFGFIVN
jgi:two-component system sensor histidine kinase/response regulator